MTYEYVLLDGGSDKDVVNAFENDNTLADTPTFVYRVALSDNPAMWKRFINGSNYQCTFVQITSGKKESYTNYINWLLEQDFTKLTK